MREILAAAQLAADCTQARAAARGGDGCDIGGQRRELRARRPGQTLESGDQLQQRGMGLDVIDPDHQQNMIDC